MVYHVKIIQINKLKRESFFFVWFFTSSPLLLVGFDLYSRSFFPPSSCFFDYVLVQDH